MHTPLRQLTIHFEFPVHNQQHQQRNGPQQPPHAQVGSLQLNNRVIMPPLTRIRAGPSHLPNDLMKEYYAQRASAGLIIAESAMIEPNLSCSYGEPGVYTDEQLAKWKEITDAVHAKGGKIFVQIYHGGRAAHPFFNNGAECVGPSPIAIVNEEVHTPAGKKKHVMPRELTVNEISAIVQQFATVAKKCVEVAGFDGIEVQASGGFLIDSFLKTSANQRTDQYGGGSLENRTRLLAEVFQAVTEAVGADKVGVKYSILGGYNDMYEENPLELSEQVAKVSQRFNLAYVHLARKDMWLASNWTAWRRPSVSISTTLLSSAWASPRTKRMM
ncbi:unnamed protein product [Aphanomyces euteiches]